jgi:hypothetical protein
VLVKSSCKDCSQDFLSIEKIKRRNANKIIDIKKELKIKNNNNIKKEPMSADN